MTGLLVTLFWFPLLGAATSRLVGRSSWFLAGAGVNALALYLAGVFHIPFKPLLVVLGGLSILVLFAVRGEPRGPRVQVPLAPTLVLWLTATVLMLGAVVTPLTDYDGRAFWVLKAKAIAVEQRIDGPFFQGASTYSPRNRYPLLVPLDAATVLMFIGDSDHRHTRALYAMFAIALAFEVRRRFAVWFSPATGGWLSALVLWLPQISGASGGARSAGGDVPLTAFAGCALFELAGANEDKRSALRFGLWIACVALTKDEGLPWALCLLVVGILVFRKRIRASIPPLALGLTALFVWRGRIGSTTDENDFMTLFARLPERLHRLDDALAAFLPWFVRLPDWGLLWLVALGAAVFLAIRRAWRPLALALAVIFPMLSLYLAAYVVTEWEVAELVRVTASRLLSHFVAPILFLVGAALDVSQSRRWQQFERPPAHSSPPG